jgi:hypothetical protein
VKQTAPNCLFLIAISIAVMAWQAASWADDDVTVVPAPTTAPAPSQKTASADGTPVVHKSLHKKKKTSTASTAAPAPVATPAPAPSAPSVVVGPAPMTPMVPHVTPAPIISPVTVTAPPPPPHAPVIPKSISVTTVSIPVPVATAPTVTPALHSPTLSPSLAPTVVETGLPVAKYSGINAPIKGVSTYVPAATPMPAKTVTGSTTHQPYYASIIPTSVIPLTSTAAGVYSTPPSHTTTPPADFHFANFSKPKTNSYPWKTGIITTEFWIGEGGSSISPTDNIGSAWDEHWRSTNRGNDSPDDRNGYASADHASTVNPFYVALPFNDLAYPEKAYMVPRSWHRPNVDGKQVSACKDRWVEIKNAAGRICFAQWEDVGPLRSDHAEYVFGNDRPNTYTRAGLDISPAVAQYLNIDENHKAITSWKFVDDEDVPPGQWLKYDEQAVIFTAMHQLKNSTSTSSDLPIQKASEPIDDQNTDSNRKRIDQSKG